MPFVNNLGVRIHYEVEGQGPPLIMQYGQYFPLEIWYELNYVDVLKNHCQLILVDARGHGQSDKPYDPEAYQIELMMSDIVAVLDHRGLDRASYMGYSSGGYLGYALAKHAPHRLRSLILGGTEPYTGPDPAAETAWHIDQANRLTTQTTAEFVASIEAFVVSLGFSPFSPRLRSAMMRHDLCALVAWHRSVVSSIPAYDDIPGKISVPCLLYAGEDTEEYANARRAAEEIPDAAFVGIPNGQHLEGGTWIETLKPHVIRTAGRL
jgi:pimeloyl-ACP methyl ester carboxylesterase